MAASSREWKGNLQLRVLRELRSTLFDVLSTLLSLLAYISWANTTLTKQWADIRIKFSVAFFRERETVYQSRVKCEGGTKKYFNNRNSYTNFNSICRSTQIVVYMFSLERQFHRKLRDFTLKLDSREKNHSNQFSCQCFFVQLSLFSQKFRRMQMHLSSSLMKACPWLLWAGSSQRSCFQLKFSENRLELPGMDWRC